jgi:2,3-bisphosphoglycerate-independent phosphoglycerate mutase
MPVKPLVLIVRDGWGRNPNPEQHEYNAIELASTPCNDSLLQEYPWVPIATSGEDVGLPDGTMGNSEVGHQNLGAGRIVYQDSVRITRSIRDERFYDNAELTACIQAAKKNNGYVHIMGLASDAGVHSLLNHLYACVRACSRMGQQKVALHLFTDGRDTGPYSGIDFVADIEKALEDIGTGKIASICGRYWAMDRDNRWERVKRAYDVLSGRNSTAPVFSTAKEAIQDYYDAPENDSQNGDEFIPPRYIGENWQETRMKNGDSAIFFNFRGDRPREIIRSFVMEEFFGSVPPSPESGAKGFDRGDKLDIHWLTMTAYEAELSKMVHVAFPKPPKMVNIAGEYLSKLGKTQFRCAETEKFPHVTFFFNDYRDEPFENEHRKMAQSPKVATYDLQPAMSAIAVRDLVLERLTADDCEDFILVNFANGDMVGHSGKLEAAIQACETVDACVQQIVDATLERGGKLVVTADHGNAEQMFNPDINSAHTSHTTYTVDCILIDPDLRSHSSGSTSKPADILRKDGRLADVMPTILEMMSLKKPDEMEGTSLLRTI